MELGKILDCYNRIVTKQFSKVDLLTSDILAQSLFNLERPLLYSGWMYPLILNNDNEVIYDWDSPKKFTTRSALIRIGWASDTLPITVKNPFMMPDINDPSELLLVVQRKDISNKLIKSFRNNYDVALQQCIKDGVVYGKNLSGFIVKVFRKEYRLKA